MFFYGFQTSVLILLCLLSLNLAAQQAADIELIQQQSDQLIRQQEQQQKAEQLLRDSQKKRTLIELQETPPSVGTVPDEKALCFPINNIQIQGVDTDFVSEIDIISAQYRNRCLSLELINQLLRSITVFYVDRGYVTSRAYIPQQDLSSGTLIIQVIEGMIESFDQSKAPSINLATSFPALSGKILNLREIEQGIEQLNRLTMNNVSIELIPGSQVGSTIISLKNDVERSWQTNFRHDNSGQSSTGELQNRLYFSHDNTFGLNDFSFLSFQTDTKHNHEGKKSDNLSLRYEIPYGFWLYSLDAYWFEYLSRVQGQSEIFDTSGKSNRQIITASRVISRDQLSKTEFVASLTRKSNDNFVEGVLLETSSRNLSIGKIEARYKRYYSHNKTLQLSLAYKQGLSLFGSPDALPSDSPQPKYGAVISDISFTSPFKSGSYSGMYNGQLSLQYSDDLLFGSEQISIGSLYTVRGFKEESLASSSGFYWRNEFSFIRPLKKNSLMIKTFAPFLALDIGAIKAENATQENEELAGVAAGLKLNGNSYSAELTFSRAIDRPEFFSADKQQLYFSVSINL